VKTVSQGRKRQILGHLAMVVGVLTLTACRIAIPIEIAPSAPAAAPSPTPLGRPTASQRPSATATASPAPPSATPSSEAPGATPSPKPASATPRSDRPSETPPPQPTPAYDQALRPAFRSDDDQLSHATRYHIDLRLDLEEAAIAGHQRVSYTNTETVPLHALYLRLFPNTPGYRGQGDRVDPMSVTGIKLNGERVEPVRELQGSALRVPLDPPLNPGGHTRLTLDFTLVLPTDGQPTDSQEPHAGYRQLGVYEGIVALANAYPIIPVYDDEGWNIELAPSYGDALFSDTAFFDVRITAPRTMSLAASGTCTPGDVDAQETTWSCVAAPMRDFNAVLGENLRAKSRNVEGIAVNSLFYAGHDDGGAAALDYASRAVRLFNARIGPYPFTELDVVETPTLAGGIEYPGLVVINQSYYQSAEGVSDRMEWVVVHEVLHQWWYSLVGNDQVDEPWLDEALVQYCTLLYYEEQYGQGVAQRLVESVFRRPYQELQETGRDQPVGLPVASYSGRDYGPVVYQKGPLYFHSLRQEVGLETFWEILETYFRSNRYRVARPEDWLAAVKAVTGSDHRPLYDAWIQESER